jgi:ketosteroid isomerase-like protein
MHFYKALSMPEQTTTIATEVIRELIHDRCNAIRNKDVERATAAFAPDVRLFDGPVHYEITDLAIETCDDLAFCHSFNHVTANTKNGGNLDIYWRETLGLKKINGRWSITHVHSSVPFDSSDGKASLSLKPGQKQ